MKISKREQIMLSVLSSLLLSIVLFFVIVKPAMSNLDEKKAAADELELQKQNIALLLSNLHLEEDYEEVQKAAAGNYNSFYSTLNSYTIDSILNKLMDNNSIQVRDMQISPYTAVNTPNDEEKAESASLENLLLVSKVSLAASAKGEDILSFVNAMNEKSVCLQVNNLSVAQAADDTGLKDFSCDIQIYGIKNPAGVSGFGKADDVPLIDGGS